MPSERATWVNSEHHEHHQKASHTGPANGTTPPEAQAICGLRTNNKTAKAAANTLDMETRRGFGCETAGYAMVFSVVAIVDRPAFERVSVGPKR